MNDRDDVEKCIIKLAETAATQVYAFIESELSEKYPDSALACKNEISLISLIKQSAIKEFTPFFMNTQTSLFVCSTSLLFALKNDLDIAKVIKHAYDKSASSPTSGDFIKTFLHRTNSHAQVASEDMPSAHNFWIQARAKIKEKLQEAATAYQNKPTGKDILEKARLDELEEIIKKMETAEKTAAFRFISFDCFDSELKLQWKKITDLVRASHDPFSLPRKAPIETSQIDVSAPQPLSRATFEDVPENLASGAPVMRP